MTARDFKTREYQKGDEDQIVELLKLSFPEWANRKNPQDYWKWKYIDTPLKSIISVAVSGDKIAGVGHEMNRDIKVGPSVLSAQYSDDYATHPDFRGMGVYNRILDEVVERSKRQFIFWLTTNPIVVNNWEKRIKPTTFNFPYPLKHLFRIQNVEEHLTAKTVKNKAITKAGLQVFRAINKAENIVPHRGKKPSSVNVSGITGFGDEYDELWERISLNHNFITKRDASYLNWRYGNPRGGDHHIREAKKDGQLAGYSVLETRKTKDYPEGYIVDILSLDGSQEVYEALLEDACNHFDDAGLNAAHLQLIEGHPMQKISAKHGFVMPPGTTYIHIGCDMPETYNANRTVLESSKPDRLHFGYGDYY